MLVVAENGATVPVDTIRWSHDDSYLVRGNENNFVVVSEVLESTAPFVFDGVVLELNANTIVNGLWRFRGECSLLGNGKRLQLGSSGCIELYDRAMVKFHDVRIEDVGGTNICCQTNDASIVLCNAALFLSKRFP